MPVDVRVKSVRQPASREDGYRVLVDRLWPRGVSKRSAALDEWARDLAPSDELRRWFGHDPERFAEFGRRYRTELSRQRERLGELRRRARTAPLTLLFGARDPEHNNALVLAAALRGGLRDE